MGSPLSIKRLDARTAGFGEELAALLRWEASAEAEIESEVRAIVTDVRTRGDSAVLEYTRRFDGLDAESVAELVIAPEQLRHAFDAIDGKARQALEVAAERITRFHSRQRQESWSFNPYWLRVYMDEPPRHDSQLRLSSHGFTLTIGALPT